MSPSTFGRLAGALTLVAACTLTAWPAAAQPPADLELALVTGGLTEPLAVRHAGDGSGRLFIVERAGRIRIWDGTQLLFTPFLNIVALVDSGGAEQGLLGLDFHPDYETNGFFYVNYTRDPGGGLDRTVVRRYQVSGNPNVADAGSGVTLLEIEQDFGNHNGGDLHFGPDGYLYIGMGDGGSGGDPLDRAQSLDTLLGKMLRIDVDGGPGNPPDCGLNGSFYTVPPGNPFADGGGGDCDEIWSWGLRNPWRWSFDRIRGDLFIGDVGQNAWEEIDFEPAATPGRNYGWRCYEGDTPFNLTGCGPPTNYRFPILVYQHSSGNCSVTGGYRYQGAVIGGLRETYIYADYCTGRIWFATEGPPGQWSTSEWANAPISPTSFGEDERGEVYVTNYFAGEIHRFESPGAIFTDGFESGDLAAWSSSSP